MTVCVVASSNEPRASDVKPKSTYLNSNVEQPLKQRICSLEIFLDMSVILGATLQFLCWLTHRFHLILTQLQPLLIQLGAAHMRCRWHWFHQVKVLTGGHKVKWVNFLPCWITVEPVTKRPRTGEICSLQQWFVLNETIFITNLWGNDRNLRYEGICYINAPLWSNLDSCSFLLTFQSRGSASEWPFKWKLLLSSGDVYYAV